MIILIIVVIIIRTVWRHKKSRIIWLMPRRLAKIFARRPIQDFFLLQKRKNFCVHSPTAIAMTFFDGEESIPEFTFRDYFPWQFKRMFINEISCNFKGCKSVWNISNCSDIAYYLSMYFSARYLNNFDNILSNSPKFSLHIKKIVKLKSHIYKNIWNNRL